MFGNAISMTAHTRTRWICLAILLFVRGVAAASSAPAGAGENNLARVAVLNFCNATQNADYEWVEKSLPDAIQESLRERFEFIRQDADKLNAIAAKFPHQDGEYQLAHAQEIARQSQSDILIYGNFRLDPTGKRLLLKAVVYNLQGKRPIGTAEESTALDAKIFRAIDGLSSQIVTKIYEFAIANQGGKEKEKTLRLLVLVPSYQTESEKQQALDELQLLKSEPLRKHPGRHLTIFEFFQEFRIVAAEQEIALNHASKRNRTALISWLEAHGVRDAWIVLVAQNKVAITAVEQGQTANPVTYPTNAPPEARRATLATLVPKTEPKKEKLDLTQKALKEYSSSTLAVAFGGGQGLLSAGERLGPLVGVNAHFSTYFLHWLQPHARFEGYYALPKDTVQSLVGGTVSAGLGYTWRFSDRFEVSPYALAGFFTGTIARQQGQLSFGLPVFSGGVTLHYFLSACWGLSLNSHAYYALDTVAPGFFVSGSVGSVYRF